MTCSCFSLTVNVWLPLPEFLTVFKCLQNVKLIYCMYSAIAVCVHSPQQFGFRGRMMFFPKPRTFVFQFSYCEDKYMAEQSDCVI